MSDLFYVLFLIFFSLKSVVSFLTNDEQKITLAISEKLNLNYCIFVIIDKSDLKSMSDIRNFSQNFVYTIFITYKDLFGVFYTKNHTFNSRTLFILKDKAMGEKLLSGLRAVEVIKDISRYTWILFSEDQKSVKRLVNRFQVPYDCQFLVIYPKNGNKTDYNLIEVYKIRTKSYHLDFGLWDQNNGLKITDEFFFLRRQNLYKTEILLEFDPDVVNATSLLDLQIDEILNEISQILNFRIRRIDIRAAVDENEDEFIAKLMDEELYHIGYFASHSTFFTSKSDKLETLTYPLFKTTFHLYIKYPDATLRSDFYIQPFDERFWLAVIFSAVTGSAAALIWQKFTLEKGQRATVDNVFLGLEYFCNQSGNDVLDNGPLRIASLSLYMTSIIVIASFGAVITSYFAVEVVEAPFNDFISFLENKEYKFAAKDLSAENLMEEFYFGHDINGKIVHFGLNEFNNNSRICREKLVFSDCDRLLLRHEIPCRLYKIKKEFANVWVSLTLSPRNLLKAIINYYVVRFYESGVRIRIQNKVQNSMLNKKEEEGFKSIELQQMIQILLIPVVGVMAAFLIVATEFVYSRL